MNANLTSDNSLPEVFQLMALAIGEAEALLVLKCIGGRRLRIPATESSPTFRLIAGKIGAENTRTLHRLFERVDTYFPKLASIERGIRNAEMRRRFDDLTKELSGRRAISLMVAEFGLSYRQIESIVNS